MLLASGAAVDARDKNGDTALMGHAFILGMVRALLAAGADPTLADNRGQTALTMARRFGCEPCATTIEEALRKRAAATAGAGQP
jgi:ankyrin repeat protein